MDPAFTDTPLFFFILGAVAGVLLLLALLAWIGGSDKDDHNDKDGGHPVPRTV